MNSAKIRIAHLIGAIIFSATAAEANPDSISQVKIQLVSAQRASQPVAGKLYKVDEQTSQRRWVADVPSSGTLQRKVSCVASDFFEAEIERAIAIPDEPVRLRCARALAFSFTQPSFAIYLATGQQTFLDVAPENVDVRTLTQLGSVAGKVGNLPLERATDDSIVVATAKWLGDPLLEKYVKRDPDEKYRLSLNREGISALKFKQQLFKIPITGQIDAFTQQAIASSSFYKGSRAVATYTCYVRESTASCGPKDPPQRLFLRKSTSGFLTSAEIESRRRPRRSREGAAILRNGLLHFKAERGRAPSPRPGREGCRRPP